MNTYDVIVLGAGPGGYVAAIRAAQRGAKVALVEREFLGGTCLNWGCIPSKAMIASAEVLHTLRHAGDFGLAADAVSFDWNAIMARRDAVVKKLRQGIAMLLKSNAVTVLEGTARLTSRRDVLVAGNNGETTISGRAIILATGSECARPKAFPFDEKRVHDSRSFFAAVKQLPASLIIVGGGVIGCEFASMLNTFGVKVTVVELLDSLLPMEDSDVSKALTRSFEKAGITVMTGAGAENVQATAKKGVTLEVAGQLLSAEMLLVAIGRSNNVPDIGLETAGVKVARNVVEVDERMQTSVAGIYAIGDITGKQQLAHVASAQALVAAENAADGRATMDYTAVPNCIFTMPEIATVGLGEEQARAAGRDVRVGSFAYAALGKALAGNHTEGFYRIVADAKTDEILGVQIMGAHATDLIAEAALAIRLECTSEELGRTIHAHPTLAEGLMEAAHAVHGVCIHAPARRR